MNKNQLVAPEIYNIVNEFEKHENKSSKTALVFQEETDIRSVIHTKSYYKEQTRLQMLFMHKD